MTSALLAREMLTAEAAFCEAAAQVLSERELEAVLGAMDREHRAHVHDRRNLRCALWALRAAGDQRTAAMEGATARALASR